MAGLIPPEPSALFGFDELSDERNTLRSIALGVARKSLKLRGELGGSQARGGRMG
ncbi:MAG: hypothetical protein ACON4K_06680 [Akkermansiaceae bacterium]